AFLWNGGAYSTLDIPGSDSAVAFGINDAGQIVGEYGRGGGASHGFLATPIPEPSAVLLLAIGTLVFVCGGCLRSGELRYGRQGSADNRDRSGLRGEPLARDPAGTHHARKLKPGRMQNARLYCPNPTGTD